MPVVPQWYTVRCLLPYNVVTVVAVVVVVVVAVADGGGDGGGNYCKVVRWMPLNKYLDLAHSFSPIDAPFLLPYPHPLNE